LPHLSGGKHAPSSSRELVVFGAEEDLSDLEGRGPALRRTNNFNWKQYDKYCAWAQEVSNRLVKTYRWLPGIVKELKKSQTQVGLTQLFTGLLSAGIEIGTHLLTGPAGPFAKWANRTNDAFSVQGISISQGDAFKNFNKYSKKASENLLKEGEEDRDGTFKYGVDPPCEVSATMEDAMSQLNDLTKKIECKEKDPKDYEKDPVCTGPKISNVEKFKNAMTAARSAVVNGISKAAGIKPDDSGWMKAGKVSLYVAGAILKKLVPGVSGFIKAFKGLLTLFKSNDEWQAMKKEMILTMETSLKSMNVLIDIVKNCDMGGYTVQKMGSKSGYFGKFMNKLNSDWFNQGFTMNQIIAKFQTKEKEAEKAIQAYVKKNGFGEGWRSGLKSLERASPRKRRHLNRLSHMDYIAALLEDLGDEMERDGGEKIGPHSWYSDVFDEAAFDRHVASLDGA